jgi:hypothetical protein
MNLGPELWNVKLCASSEQAGTMHMEHAISDEFVPQSRRIVER